MDRIRIPIWVSSVLLVFLIRAVKPEQDDVKQSMISFLEQLSGGNGNGNQNLNLGWNMSSDPCTEKWVGVSCDLKNTSVKRIVLEELNFNGVLDPNLLCNKTASLTVLSIIGNKVSGNLPDGIGNCRQLTHLYLGRNRLSGTLPGSLSRLSNLKRLDISSNAFSGELPEIGRISGLLSLFAENNDLEGAIPEFDFSNLEDFNVSNNNFSGQVPDVQGRFGSDSFSNNPRLCGDLVSNPCKKKTSSSNSKVKRVLIYSGYILLGSIVVLFVAYKVRNSMKSSKDRNVLAGKGLGIGDKKSSNVNSSSSEYKSTSVEGLSPSPLIVLNGGPVVKGLRFEDLLRAPAELLGKGKHGSLYKVLLGGGVTLAVKRIKDWEISKQEFRKRIKRIDQVKHPNLLSAVAFYCSNQEKLLAYEYQQNGSLYKLLHGSQNGQMFDWGSRLGVAASLSEALAFIHNELRADGIAHGNLKSTNILFKTNMEPCISEYGLMAFEIEQPQSQSQSQSQVLSCSVFETDVYRFGVILLELLTGKPEESNGEDLAGWVHSVVSEEWTVEVFDKALVRDGTSEERMVNLLQVALKCISQNPDQRPNMNQVVEMINAIREEEERSTGSDQW